ncbi:MAG: mycothiol transferase [Jatrophihabitans sp.]|uniref:mycothiol transferase n=1 Tax=Jatrophihabitans sp. TaxID=1932789 RepID=UPI003F7F6F77
MRAADVLLDALDRVSGVVHHVLDGIGDEALTFRADAEANTVAWLVWHLTRVQDDHVADAAGTTQVWRDGGWHERFGLPFDADATGYGQSADDVGAVRVGADLLRGYYDATHAATADFVRTLGEDDLDRVVDDRWDPPVTLGVRLVSVLSDDLQHAGQAAYLRGLAERA